MKKLFYLMIVLAVFLVGCSAGEVKISDVKNVPNKVQELMDLEIGLQMISKDGEEKYIVYKSKKAVTADVKLDGDVLQVLLKNGEDELSEEVRHVFKLTGGDTDYDTIMVLIDGVETALDGVTLF